MEFEMFVKGVFLFVGLSSLGCTDKGEDASTAPGPTPVQQKRSAHKARYQWLGKKVDSMEKYLKSNKDDNHSACRHLGKELGVGISRIIRENVEREYGSYVLTEELELTKQFTTDQINKVYDPLQKQLDKALKESGSLSAQDSQELSDGIMAAVQTGVGALDREVVQKAINKMERSHIEALQKHCLCPQCDFSVQDHPDVRKFFKSDEGIYQVLCENIQHDVAWYCQKRIALDCQTDLDSQICFLWKPSLYKKGMDVLNNVFK